MRRVKPSAGLSPQQLKHFAVAAVTITGLLALFASGEDWGAKAQISAVEAKNRMVEAEAQKLGTRKITSSMAVNKPVDTGFGEAAGPSAIGAGGGGGSMAPAPVVVQRANFAPCRIATWRELYRRHCGQRIAGRWPVIAGQAAKWFHQPRQDKGNQRGIAPAYRQPGSG
jgi:hypothetical protein